MKLIANIDNYMKERIYEDKYDTFLRTNKLFLSYYSYFNPSNLEFLEEYSKNKETNQSMTNLLVEISELLKQHGIQTIHFKGVTLSILLYENPYLRKYKDIDFIVDYKDFDIAVDILKNNGFSVTQEYDQHHIIFYKNDIKVEMHTCFFHPVRNVDFSVDDKSLKYINVNDHQILTINETSLFLYLLYHTYVHLWWTEHYSDNKYFSQAYQNRTGYSVQGKLYDIALLVDKYKEEIDWEYCLNRLCKDELRTEFKMMLLEFNYTYPDLLPASFLEKMLSKNYITENEFFIFNYIYQNYMQKNISKKYDDIIREILLSENNYVSTIEQLTKKPLRYRYHIVRYLEDMLCADPPIKEGDLSYDFDLWKSDKSINLEFRIVNHALLDYFNYNHLHCNLNFLIAGEGNRFNSIIARAEEDENKRITLTPYNCTEYKHPDISKFKHLDISAFVSSELEVNENQYILKIEIPYTYIGVNKNTENYLDIAIGWYLFETIKFEIN